MAHDNKIKPGHYSEMGMQPNDYIMANESDFTWCISNVIKYVSRYTRKNGVEDLKKARWYLDKQIEELEGEQ